MIKLSQYKRQEQADIWVQGQPSLQRKFQDSQDYCIVRPCLKKTEQNKQKTKLSQFN